MTGTPIAAIKWNIGDSLESDVLPAVALGVRTIYVCREDQIPEGVQKISSLLQLHEFLPG